MKTQQPDNLNQARQLARRRRRRRLMIIRTAIVLSIVLLLALVGTLVVMKIIATQQSKRGETTGFLAVRNIVVEGETRYTPEQLIEKSGLYVGQSLMGVNKVQAHDLLMQNFPYLNGVEIGNASFDTLRIRVTETEVLGAVQAGDEWFIVGVNNHALEKLTADALPASALRVVGATLEGETIGQTLLDERSLRVVRTVASAASLYQLEGMTTVDITEKTNLSILIHERLRVVFGNETNIPAQIEMLVDTLPVLYQNNGSEAAGRLDMTTYADEDPNNDKAVFTPSELLTQSTTGSTAAPTEGETTTTTTAE